MRTRQHDLIDFYELLAVLEAKSGGVKRLSDCHGRMNWPNRGVYFFMEPGEIRSHSGTGLRVVRVGTHGLKAGSKSTLWKRLSQHKGTTASRGGNHRGSVFRLLVGATLLDSETGRRTWGRGQTASREVRLEEMAVEQDVSRIMGNMPFLCLGIPDEPGPDSVRGFVERNAIALLSNLHREALDPASPGWRGHRSGSEKVRLSGLWNQNHVHEAYDPAFLGIIETFIEATGQNS